MAEFPKPIDSSLADSLADRAQRLRAAAEAKRSQQATSDSASGQSSEVISTKPVGQGDYVVMQGDCMSSIAKEQGYARDTLWNHPDNAELKEVRKDPNVLLPGDRVTLPEKEKRYDTGQTEMRHHFVRRVEESIFQLRLLRNGKPRKEEAYELEIDDEMFEGVTDEAGHLEHVISSDAQSGKLTLSPETSPEVIRLKLGGLDPIDSVSGALGRLKNLGYYRGNVDATIGPSCQPAIAGYQKVKELQVTGELDQQTQSKLKEDYGC